MSTATMWDGSFDGVLIADQTDPWLQVDGKVLDLSGLPEIEGKCGEFMHLAPGVLLMNGPTTIQRCDACNLYGGDLEAAQALAAHLNNGATVWFDAEDKED